LRKVIENIQSLFKFFSEKCTIFSLTLAFYTTAVQLMPHNITVQHKIVCLKTYFAAIPKKKGMATLAD